MSDLYFNEESDYSEENTNDNESKMKIKCVVMRAMRRKLWKQSFADIPQNRCSEKLCKFQLGSF